MLGLATHTLIRVDQMPHSKLLTLFVAFGCPLHGVSGHPVLGEAHEYVSGLN